MKLAEALILRADLKKRIDSLRQRLGKNAVVQEGNQPHEVPAELMAESFAILKQMRELVQKINQTNSRATLTDGRTLSDAIAQREELKQRHSVIQHAITSSIKEPDRYSMAEIKWIACVDVKQLQKQLEDLSQSIRELNILIQETNWKTDLG